MNKEILVLSILCIFLHSNTNFLVTGSQIENNIIYVNADNILGPWYGTYDHPYRYIRDGLTNSTTGDIVYVFNGIYYENISIDKTITISGENKNKTIIDGSNNDCIIRINNDEVTIMNFTIRNSGGYKYNCGIKIESDSNLISNCVIYQTKAAIYINNADENKISNCTFHNNGEGVFLNSSNKGIIEGCSIEHNSIGIHFDKTCNSLIKYSYLHTNGIACFLNSSSNFEIVHCNISDNSVNLGGVFILECENINVNNCIFRHNGAGMCIYSSDKLSIMNSNFILNTHFAISMRTPSRNINISRCEIRDSLRYGIYIEKYNSCNIANNNIFNNTLQSINSKSLDCIARYNWWGSTFGPSLFGFRSSSKITWIPGRIKIFPWLFEPLEEIGANWEVNEPYMNDKINYKQESKICLDGTDTDGDGCPDWWEKKWNYDPMVWDDHGNLDEDEDALNNYQECYTDEYGSNPRLKDIFIELDWMESLLSDESNKPPEYLLKRLVNIFKTYQISLHIDTGNLGGGEEIPFCKTTFSFAKLRDLYWDYFLHNNINNPRKNIFHYGIVCNYCPDLNFPYFGWNNLDSFAVSAEWLKEENPQFSRGRLISGALVHHLGHTLGLVADTYGGIDNVGTIRIFTKEWWKYKNYKSCMNYCYKYKLLSFSDGTHGPGDFNDWDNLDFGFFKNTSFK
jgi:parallel beta-helix repeat protein